MNQRPSIGITTHNKNEKGRFDLNAKYVEGVRRACGYPVLLPPGEQEPEECLDFLDGIILTGGADVDPKLYGGKNHPAVYGVDAVRDASETALLDAIFERATPTLCICRGMQLLNVALGGSLIEHLDDEIGDEIIHRRGELFHTHDVTIVPESQLARIVGATRISTASMHHQALRRVAPSLTVVAQARDGVIEAVEHNEHKDLIAVQWHPEHTAAEDKRQQALFNWLVATLKR